MFVAASAVAQAPNAPQDSGTRMTADRVLGFEQGFSGATPLGWWGRPTATIAGDREVVHGGQWSARLERKSDSEGTFSVLGKPLPIDFTGKQIELRGFLRTDGVDGFAGLWLREDGAGGEMLSLNNMESEHLHGTTPWTEHAVRLPLDKDTRQIVFGALLQGKGRLWVDDLQLLVDGQPIANAPAATPLAPTVLERVHDFDGGSGLAIDKLSDVQVQNLALLGRVWGFLKYHHPAVAAGTFQWDYELLRILPAVVKAGSDAEARLLLLHWIDGLGPVGPCRPCAHLDDAGLALKPDLAWLKDEALLGKELSARLQQIYVNRPVGAQFYVSLQPTVSNPSFDHELRYASIKFPDPGFQLLALFRFWNILQYWSPDREVAGQVWPDVLREFVPRVALAHDFDAFQLAMTALVAKDNDTHANLWRSYRVRPPVGVCQLPVNLRFLDGRAVVSSYAAKEAGPASGLKLGDTLKEIGGEPVAALVERWRPFYAASNDAARLSDMGRSFTRGVCGAVPVQILRESQTILLNPSRLPLAGMDHNEATHDLPGETFRLLSKDVAYLKLSSIKAEDLSHYMELARDTRGLIVDIRNYPSSFMVFVLGQRLVTQATPFALLTHGDLANPGAFVWELPAQTLEPALPHYPGKVIVLVDEVSVSQAEYTTMALRSAPNTLVVGSTTAGADGNVSPIRLPGDLGTAISGLGVFYPDRTPTQRVGVRIDIEAKPTVAGLAAGRDEVLEVALRQILGDAVPQVEVERLARR